MVTSFVMTVATNVVSGVAIYFICKWLKGGINKQSTVGIVTPQNE